MEFDQAVQRSMSNAVRASEVLRNAEVTIVRLTERFGLKVKTDV